MENVSRQLIMVAQVEEFISDRVENNVEKGENAGCQYFLLFWHCFKKTSFLLKDPKNLNELILYHFEISLSAEFSVKKYSKAFSHFSCRMKMMKTLSLQRKGNQSLLLQKKLQTRVSHLQFPCRVQSKNHYHHRSAQTCPHPGLFHAVCRSFYLQKLTHEIRHTNSDAWTQKHEIKQSQCVIVQSFGSYTYIGFVSRAP